ncbi:MAG: 5-formyltetrahydrofolate cyclo-ligase [archaeon]
MKEITRMQNIAKRNSLTKEQVESKSKCIEERLAALPEFAKAKTVMLYYGISHEVETRGLIERALKAGKRVALPATNFEKKAMVPLEISSLEELHKTNKGLFEPKTQRPVMTSELDLVIVPGVAFDKTGGRLGRGKGFYDALLRKTSTKVPLIGLCFEENLEKSLPCESHDVKMDIVVTDEQAIRCKE